MNKKITFQSLKQVAAQIKNFFTCKKTKLSTKTLNQPLNPPFSLAACWRMFFSFSPSPVLSLGFKFDLTKQSEPEVSSEIVKMFEGQPTHKVRSVFEYILQNLQAYSKVSVPIRDKKES